MKIYTDKDCNLNLIRTKKVTVIGYGSQGHAHANNLKDSGINVLVGLRKSSTYWEQAQADGLRVLEIKEAVKQSDFIVILTSDDCHGQLYKEQIEPYLHENSTIAFAHGFSIQYKQIIPKENIDVIMIAPKGPGNIVRSEYLKGKGAISLIAVDQDYSGKAKDMALSYASAIGSGKVGIIETSFKNETETDLFGEQAVIVGGVVELIKAGFETLVEDGYPSELAYLECLHEMKFIADLLYKKGITDMNCTISNNAEFGEYVSGRNIIGKETRQAMKECLENIKNATYAKQFISEGESNYPCISLNRKKDKEHLIEHVGKRLRSIILE